MEGEFKVKYEKYKIVVKLWENDFKKQKNRIPSKYDIKDAPYKVKQAYKMYYRMKTSYLTETLTDILEDDDDEEKSFEENCSELLEISHVATTNLDNSFSDSIHELLNPANKLPNLTETKSHNNSNSADIYQQEFESVGHNKINDNDWNVNLKKQSEQPTKKADKLAKNLPRKKITLKMEDAQILKAPRNPRKAFSKTKSQKFYSTESLPHHDELPDLETILLEKSRSSLIKEVKKIEQPSESEIKTVVDNSWLDRNVPINQSIANNDDAIQNKHNNLTHSLSTTSSFGLSNLNLKSFNSSSSFNLNVEVKYHSGDAIESECIEKSEEKKEEILPISKKRRLLTDAQILPLESSKPVPDLPNFQEIVTPKVIPEKPKRKFQITENVVEKEKPPVHRYFDTDDSDADPTFEVEKINQEKSPSPLVMKRKKSLIKRSKEGISKVKKKATKLLSRGKKSLKSSEEQEDQNEIEEEPEINFFIDTDFNKVENIPRVSEKELKATEKLFENFAHQEYIATAKAADKISDHKISAKQEALEKKIKSGTLNDNFVRINMKKKVFVRGKKAFNFSRYKKTLWKSKKAASLDDMRGCDGGVVKCFNCGGVGHFAQQCKQKGDNLLPIEADVEDSSPFPTLEQAAQMANEKKLFAHSTKIDSLPTSSNEIWKEQNLDEGNDEHEFIDKENQTANIEPIDEYPVTQKKAYIGHKIPKEFLQSSGILEQTIKNKDEIKSYLDLNPDGSVPKEIPQEVLRALKLFGHKSFRKGQAEATMRILCGVSTLVTLSTGSGKSLCYQLPAYLYRQKFHCITLVISPLVSLMEDQVHGIPDFVNAQCLHTNQTPKQREKIMEEIKNGKVEILLVSPEAVVSGEKSTGFGSLLRQLPPIAFACIDEAHCVSQWSHNFRPSYLMICRVLREKLGVKTVLGLTATATLQTRNSIVNHLSIPDGLQGIISDIPLPENLILTISMDENRDRALLSLLKSERFESLQSIIIYCTRRDECERISGYLRTCLQNVHKQQETNPRKRKRVNWTAESYHAGMPASRRRTIQNAFMAGELRIVIATIAFGMGINKSDIRGIIHYNMPKSFESYVQEVGRAGRDGKISHCHVFLDSKGKDLSELRRHVFANSIDRHVIRKMLRKVFVPCSCKQRKEIPRENNRDLMDISMEEQKIIPRSCAGHEVSFSIEETVQALDIPEENISTILCYLELHEQRYIKVLGNAYTKCKIISYSGPNFMKQAAKTCPPLAMAIALHLKSGKKQEDLGTLEFCVVEVASAIGWDSGIVKYQLKQLEWTIMNGANRRSPLTVTFSDLGFRIRSPGDLTDEELDLALDSLENRTRSQEKTQLIQLQIIFDTFASLAFSNFTKCSSKEFPTDESDKLKTIIRKYFQSDLPIDVEITNEYDDTADEEIISNIRQMTQMYPENNFSGRSLARIFHGISSPCFSAVIWGRCKFWRAHLSVNFHRLVNLGNKEIVKIRLH